MAPCLLWECPKPWDWDTFPALGVFPAGSTPGVHIPCGCSSLGCLPFIPGAAARHGWVGRGCPRSQPSPKEGCDVPTFGAALLSPPLQGTIPLSELSPVQQCFAPHTDRLSENFPGRLEWFWGPAAMSESRGWQQPEQGVSWVAHWALHKPGTPLWAPRPTEAHPQSPSSLESSPSHFFGVQRCQHSSGVLCSEPWGPQGHLPVPPQQLWGGP